MFVKSVQTQGVLWTVAMTDENIIFFVAKHSYFLKVIKVLHEYMKNLMWLFLMKY